MKKLIILLLAFALVNPSFSQDDVNALIEEGIQLHDKGEYEAAIAKYDQVLKNNPSNTRALYEKSYTLMLMKKYEECEVICIQLLKTNDYRKEVIVQYGSLLDMTNRQKESLEVYNKGIKEFPDFFLLYYNKGITLSGLSRDEEAMESFQHALKYKPLHASSHNAIGRMIKKDNRIPAIMAFVTFLIVEPQTERAAQNLNSLNALVTKGVQQKDSGNVSISIDAALLDDKKKKRENDFSNTELIFSLTSAMDNSEPFKNENDAERLKRKLDFLVSSMAEGKKKGKGFFWDFYVPFFADMKSKEFLGTACYIVHAGAGKEEIKQWIKDNEDKVTDFYAWVKGYSWNTK
jgi:tetratricopeptide (TPR) repeat protein